MKLKKFIAFATSLVLAMSSMTALAAEGVIEGDMNYVNTTIYKVTLPTTAGMSFTLDPQGLAALDVSGGDTTASAGDIISTGTMTAVNESSVPVILEVDFTVSDGDTTKAMTYSTNGTIANENAKEIALTISPVSGGDALATINVNATSSPKTFNMAAAKYTFGGSSAAGYTYNLTAGSGSTIDMTIGGKIAKLYDWSAYSKKAATPATLTLNAVFKFYKDNSGTKGDVVDADAADTTPTTPTTPVYSKKNGATITLDTTKNVVSSVAWGAAEDKTPNAVSTSDFSFDKTTKELTLPSGLFGQAEADSTRYIKVTYGDSSSVVIAVTIAE